jgi:hypothetical protein
VVLSSHFLSNREAKELATRVASSNNTMLAFIIHCIIMMADDDKDKNVCVIEAAREKYHHNLTNHLQGIFSTPSTGAIHHGGRYVVAVTTFPFSLFMI